MVKGSKILTQELSTSFSGKAQSTVWDIEKDSAVLPTESSPLLSLKSRPSTIFLELAQKKWGSDPLANGDQNQKLVIERADTAKVEARGLPSLVSSIESSESPSQVSPAANPGSSYAEGIPSDHFLSRSPLRIEHPVDCTEQTEATAPTLGDIIQVPVEAYSPLNHGVERPSSSLDPERQASNLVAPLDEENLQCLQREQDGSDWLLSDCLLGRYSSESEADGWPFVEDMLGAQLEGVHGVLALTGEEVVDMLRGSDHYDHYTPLVNEPHGRFLDEFWCSGEGDDAPDPGCDRPEVQMAYDECIRLVRDDSTDLESDDGLDGTDSGSLKSTLVYDNEDPSSPLMRFNEGRYLLREYKVDGPACTSWHNLESIEADVARRLIGHWVPQKY